MDVRAESQLSLLADAETSARLTRMGLPWTALDANVADAVRFKRSVGRKPERPMIVGLVGGASSGKSTIFNTLVGREVSRISAHAHETLGPVAAVDQALADRFVSWIGARELFRGLGVVELNGSTATIGRVDAIHVYRRPPSDRATAGDSFVVLLDLPDVTSRMSSDEGSVARNLLPWFDGLVAVVDEERWFDAAVFEDVLSFARNFGTRVWVVFNRTERTEGLSDEELRTLSEHATSRHVAGHCVSPFSPGSGYRPVSDDTRACIDSWMAELKDLDRTAALDRHLRRRCAEVLADSVARGRQFDELRRNVDAEVATLTDATRLSADLLTDEERGLLGLGHRFVPLFDAVTSVRRWLDWGKRRRAKRHGEGGVDFEKNVDRLADVLRRNLEHRFQHATDSIDRLILDSSYQDPGNRWRATWTVPSFDERQWAGRIRAHIDAWKQETAKQSRAGDVASVAIGTPLLLADLLILGGAGMTLTWSVTWVAGFLGGKGLLRVFQGSPAFAAYQTTVSAYQAFIRESLLEQCEANLSAMPRRHLAMNDPLIQAILPWSSPGDDRATRGGLDAHR